MVETATFIDDSAQARAACLLRLAYEQILVPVFGSDLDSYEKIMRSLKGRNSGLRAVVTVTGENLDDHENCKLSGAAVAYYYPRENIGILAYIAKAKDSEIKGIGAQLIAERRKALDRLASHYGKKLEALFLEVHDPCKVSAENDSMDPEARIRLFNRLGAAFIPCKLAIVASDQDLQTFCHDHLLGSYPVNGQQAGPGAVRKYLRATFSQVIKNPKDNPCYIRNLRAVERWERTLKHKHHHETARVAALGSCSQPG